jgi:hypothetical protein
MLQRKTWRTDQNVHKEQQMMTDCLFRNSIIEHGQRNWEIYYDQRPEYEESQVSKWYLKFCEVSE